MRLGKYSREVFGGKGGLTRFFTSLESDFAELHRRMDLALRHRSVIYNVVFDSTNEYRLRHDLGRTPTYVRITPHGDARIWELRSKRSAQEVFLKSSATVEAQVEVKG